MTFNIPFLNATAIYIFRKPGGGWITLNGWITFNYVKDYTVAYFMGFGFDLNIPFRPWPQLFSEVHDINSKRSAVITVIAWFGFCIGIQTLSGNLK